MSSQTLEIRPRGIPGTDSPLSSETLHVFAGELLGIELPLSNVLPTGVTIVSLASEVKVGRGLSVTELEPSVLLTDATFTLQVSASPTRGHLFAIQAVLSTGETWEVNVPCEVMQKQ